MRAWQLQQAKARLSEVVKIVMSEGPQTITVRDEPVVVMISKAQYDELTKAKDSFVTFMRKSPLSGVNIDIKRDKSLTRDIDL